MRKVEYLVGNKKFKFISRPPYSDLVCNFIYDLSSILFKHQNSKNYSDIKTLAFWCRKQNIDIMKNNFNKNELRVGLGLVFHITPSNVPTNLPKYQACVDD